MPIPSGQVGVPIDIAADNVVPDLDRLVAAVQERSPLHHTYLHGDQHWRAVAEVGLRLLPDQRWADPMVVFLFALFHDAMRKTEHEDPSHGRRGAELAREFNGEYFELSPKRIDILAAACEGHTELRYSEAPTIGICLDADRLNLWRVGKTPDPRYLSTDLAVDDEIYRWSKYLHGNARVWEELLQAYTA